MDYPDSDEEYELMHADEFELMNELDDEELNFQPQKRFKNPSQKKLDFSGSQTSNAGNIIKEPALNEYPEDEDLLPYTDDPVSSVVSNSPGIPSVDEEIVSVNNKRSVADLFGDITDLETELSLTSKRQKLEEEFSKEDQQEKLIRTIVEQRKRLIDDKLHFRQNVSNRTSNREGCISAGIIPKWPFIPICVRGERVYARLHKEDEQSGKLKDLCSRPHMGLLDIPYSELYSLAMSDASNKIDKDAAKDKRVIVRNPHNVDLWVEKYKPKVYLQLLSDEATNRSLLHWLKLWDKVVFNREPKVFKRGLPPGQDKSNLLDEYHRPMHKVALLCGPPGLGKTTLAHMLCKQAGYSPVEVNASDERTAQSFKLNLDAATQMKSVVGSNSDPNCLILDEIDGAPQPAIDVLVKYVNNKGSIKEKKKKGAGILKRPIICICNDLYAPSLRSLRQIAFTIVFPPTSSTRLGERLMEISKMEKIITDLGTMMSLSEKSNNDIRSCLSVLQYLKAKSPRVTLSQVQSSNVGKKDMQHGLFSVWETIFHIKLDRKKTILSMDISKPSRTSNLNSSSYNVMKTVQSYGDYDRLTVGVFENYAKVRTTESSFTPILKAMDFFIFNDLLSTYIQSSQNYAVYGYLPWSFVLWHLLFASIHRPRLSYPAAYYEANSSIQRNKQILGVAFSGMAPKLQSFQHKSTLLLDVAPILVELITPIVRPVSFQLYSQKEKDEVQRVIGIMADYNLSYIQIRTPEGSYAFNLDPDLEELVSFGERQRENITTYTVKQNLAKEVESEKIRRTSVNSAIPNDRKEKDKSHSLEKSKPKENPSKEPSVPNHLQKLIPKELKNKPGETHSKDFFGRPIVKSVSEQKSNAKTNDIVKSDIWFHFKEGYNNAVRKNVYISDLL